MINKIISMFRRPPIAIRISPHTRKLQIVPVIYLDTYDPKQVGDLDGDPELGRDD